MKKLFISLMIAVSIPFLIIPLGMGDDWEYWQRLSLTIPVSERLSIGVTPTELRFHHANDLYYVKIYLGGSYKVSDNFSAGIYYSRKTVEKGGGWQGENILYFDAVPKVKLGDFALSNRFRVGRLFATSSFEIRNLTKLAHPKILWGRKFTLFVADEIFYYTKGTGFKENRFYLGGSTALGKGFSLELSYLFKYVKKVDSWERFHIIISNIKYSF